MKKFLSLLLIFLIAAATLTIVSCNGTEESADVSIKDSGGAETSPIQSADQSETQSIDDPDPEYTIEFYVRDELDDTVKYRSTDRNFMLTPCNVSGYDFNAWLDEDGKEVAEIDTSLKTDYRLYASLSPIEYKVTFDPNGGSGTMSDMTLTYDLTAELIPNAFSNGDRPFKGWALTENGEIKYVDRGSIINACDVKNGSVILYAIWGKSGEIELPIIII